MTDRATEENTQTAETMIRLEDLTKVFPAQDEPAAVDPGPGLPLASQRQDHRVECMPM